MARTQQQIQSDLKYLNQWLSANYGIPVRDKIFKKLDDKLDLGGKLVNWLTGKAAEKILGNLNIAYKVMNFTLGIFKWGLQEGQLEAADRKMNPYSPKENWNEYVEIMILAWKRGDFRYCSLEMSMRGRY